MLNLTPMLSVRKIRCECCLIVGARFEDSLIKATLASVEATYIVGSAIRCAEVENVLVLDSRYVTSGSGSLNMQMLNLSVMICKT